MATLTVNGTKITVDDSFLSLPKAQQEATVNEIASKLGVSSQATPPAGAVPGSKEYSDWAIAQVRAGNKLPQVSPPPPEYAAPQAQPNILDAISAGFTSGVNALPIIGPSVMGGLENAKAAFHGQTPEQIAADDQRMRNENQLASGIGAVTGTVAPFLVGGAIPGVAKVLGMGPGSLLSRSLFSAGSSSAIAGADTLARGGSMEDAGKSALLGGGIGAVAPGLGDLLGKGLSVAGEKVSGLWNTAFNPEAQAQRLISGSAANDVRAGKAMTQADEASAALNGQPIINADRFGTNVRQLSRTAANSNPAARAALTDQVEQRFLTQAGRAKDFITRVAPAVDDLGALEALQTAARASNKVRYDAARSNPAARVIWTPEIKNLFQSPDFLAAIKGAERTAANDAASSGVKSVKNPFVFDANGNIGLRKMADGSTALPGLEFWDIVQRNLRATSEKAFRDGDKLLGSQVADMRRQLLSSLDNAVPEFAAARQGAAKAFGAEDALEAGKKFVQQKMAIPEARKAYAALSPAEKKLFATGFASELLDKIGASSDRVNVINQIFGSPAARAQVELALGKNAATELEQFTRVEDIMHMTKNEVTGNSTTARQLLASGALGAGAGGLLSGWDPKSIASGAFLMAAGRMGARALGQAVDQRILKIVADVLASGDATLINKQILNAALSPAHAGAIKAIQAGLQASMKGAALSSGRQPIEITVHGGAR